MLEVLGGLGVLHQLPFGKGGHHVPAGPAPLPGGIGDMEAEESRPVEGHLVEAVGRAVGEEAAAQAAAQALGVCGDRGKGSGSARSHPRQPIAVTSIKLCTEFARPQPRATRPTHSFVFARFSCSGDFSNGRAAGLIFPFLICIQHSFGFIETGGFLAQSELFIALVEGCGTESVGRGEGVGLAPETLR